MTTRPKTFNEFVKAITIVYNASSGCKITCNLKRYVLVECRVKPWNSVSTRRTFLINMYIREVLLKTNIPKCIRRPAGYELLGKRCLWRDQVVTVCAWVELVNPQTGEVTKELTLAGRWHTPVPFKAMENEVQL